MSSLAHDLLSSGLGALIPLSAVSNSSTIGDMFTSEGRVVGAPWEGVPGSHPSYASPFLAPSQNLGTSRSRIFFVAI